MSQEREKESGREDERQKCLDKKDFEELSDFLGTCFEKRDFKELKRLLEALDKKDVEKLKLLLDDDLGKQKEERKKELTRLLEAWKEDEQDKAKKDEQDNAKEDEQDNAKKDEQDNASLMELSKKYFEKLKQFIVVSASYGSEYRCESHVRRALKIIEEQEKHKGNDFAGFVMLNTCCGKVFELQKAQKKDLLVNIHSNKKGETTQVDLNKPVHHWERFKDFPPIIDVEGLEDLVIKETTTLTEEYNKVLQTQTIEENVLLEILDKIPLKKDQIESMRQEYFFIEVPTMVQGFPIKIGEKTIYLRQIYLPNLTENNNYWVNNKKTRDKFFVEVSELLELKKDQKKFLTVFEYLDTSNEAYVYKIAKFFLGGLLFEADTSFCEDTIKLKDEVENLYTPYHLYAYDMSKIGHNESKATNVNDVFWISKTVKKFCTTNTDLSIKNIKIADDIINQLKELKAMDKNKKGNLPYTFCVEYISDNDFPDLGTFFLTFKISYSVAMKHLVFGISIPFYHVDFNEKLVEGHCFDEQVYLKKDGSKFLKLDNFMEICELLLSKMSGCKDEKLVKPLVEDLQCYKVLKKIIKKDDLYDKKNGKKEFDEFVKEQIGIEVFNFDKIKELIKR